MQLSKPDVRDLLRSAGGLLLAAGAVLLLLREPEHHHHWGHFAATLIVLLPAAVLYVLGLGVLEPSRDRAEPAQSVLLVLAILLAPIALLELLQWVGASLHHLLYVAVVFAVTGLLAGYAAQRASAAYAALLGALAILVSWLLVWDKVIGHPSPNTIRWLLVAAAVILALSAVWLLRREAVGAGEVATVAGLAGISAGLLGVVLGLFVGVARSAIGLAGLTSSSSSRLESAGNGESPLGGPAARLVHHVSGLQRLGWDVYLLVVSVALVWIGSRARVRGLGYVGGLGLFAFLVSAGAQVTRLEAGRRLATGIGGWPLVLLILGVVGLAASALRTATRQR